MFQQLALLLFVTLLLFFLPPISFAAFPEGTFRAAADIVSQFHGTDSGS
jgi:hypothetical protein